MSVVLYLLYEPFPISSCSCFLYFSCAVDAPRAAPHACRTRRGTVSAHATPPAPPAACPAPRPRPHAPPRAAVTRTRTHAAPHAAPPPRAARHAPTCRLPRHLPRAFRAAGRRSRSRSFAPWSWSSHGSHSMVISSWRADGERRASGCPAGIALRAYAAACTRFFFFAYRGSSGVRAGAGRFCLFPVRCGTSAPARLL